MPTPKTYAAMLKQISQMQEQAESLRKKESVAVIKRIREAMAVYGITVEELDPKRAVKPKDVESPEMKRIASRQVVAPRPAAGRSKPVKYRDKQGHTWAGGGSMPTWLRDAVAGGASIEDFLVKVAA